MGYGELFLTKCVLPPEQGAKREFLAMTPKASLRALALFTLFAFASVSASAEPLIGPRQLNSGWRGSLNAAPCKTDRVAIDELRNSRDLLGGRIVGIVGGADQSFADTWRGLVGQRPVTVSLILAHGFTRAIDSRRYVEIIEFDGNGCAFTKTFIPDNLWDTILRLLKSASYTV